MTAAGGGSLKSVPGLDKGNSRSSCSLFFKQNGIPWMSAGGTAPVRFRTAEVWSPEAPGGFPRPMGTFRALCY